MAEAAIDMVYAEALLALGEEQKSLDELYEELRALRRLLEQDPSLLVFLGTPSIGSAVKRRVLESAFEGRASSTLKNFVFVCLDKGRQGLIPRIVERFEEAYHRNRNEVVAELHAAVPVPEATRAAIGRALEKRYGKTILFEERERPELLGGVLVKVEGDLFDDSLRTKLRDLEKELRKRRLQDEALYED